MKLTLLLVCLLALLFSASLCYGHANIVEVVGFGECADCNKNNIKPSEALSGLKVTIDCKVRNGKFQTRGVGKLNEEGQFMVNLPQEILKDGKLSEECYVQLHNAANAPCAFHNGLEASKINFVSKSSQKHTFGPTGDLKFSSAICTSSTLWPPFPKSHPWYKKFHHIFPHPPVVLPPIPNKKTFPPPVVVKPKPNDPEPKPEPKLEPKPEPKTKQEPKPKPKGKPEPKSKPKPKTKPEPKPEPKQKPEPKSKPKPKTKPELKPEPKQKPEPKPKPEPKTKPDPKQEPEPKPEPKPESKPCPPKILSPPIPIYKPHPKILPLIHKKPSPPQLVPKLPPLPTLPPKGKHHLVITVPPHP